MNKIKKEPAKLFIDSLKKIPKSLEKIFGRFLGDMVMKIWLRSNLFGFLCRVDEGGIDESNQSILLDEITLP